MVEMLRAKHVLIPLIALFVLVTSSCGSNNNVKEPPKTEFPPYHIKLVDLPPRVKIMLSEKAAAESVTLNGPFVVMAAHLDRALGNGDRLTAATVSATDSGIRLGDSIYPIAGVRLRPAGDANVSIQGRKYRGDLLIFRRAGNTVDIINELPLEEYLYGVIGSEMYASWPQPALCAQAVAARTFVLYRMMMKRGEPYHVFADTRSQVYKGIEGEMPSVHLAVDSTKGVVMTCHGEIFSAYYHAYCGGETLSAPEVFGNSAIQPLSGIQCPNCKKSRKPGEFEWTTERSKAELDMAMTRLGKYGKIDNVESLRPIIIPGRVHNNQVEVGSGGKSYLIGAVDFRQAANLRSTGITSVERKGDKFIIKGVGYGHGVGMCQWGAYGLAQLDWDYKRILEYYYPNSMLQLLGSN